MLQNDLLTCVGALIGSSGAILSCEWGASLRCRVCACPPHCSSQPLCKTALALRPSATLTTPLPQPTHAFTQPTPRPPFLPSLRHHVRGHEPLPGQRHPGRLRHARGQGRRRRAGTRLSRSFVLE